MTDATKSYQADCPEDTTEPPQYLTHDAEHGNINNCVVSSAGFDVKGTSHLWCCSQPIKEN